MFRPSRFKVAPEIHVLIDTSGSMGAHDIAMALGMVGKVLNSLRLRSGVHVVCGDVSAKSAGQIFDPSKIEVVGGGGTMMGRMMREMVDPEDKRQKRPDVIIVCTDGAVNDWPLNPLPCKAIACITQKRYMDRFPVPSWMDAVCMEY